MTLSTLTKETVVVLEAHEDRVEVVARAEIMVVEAETDHTTRKKKNGVNPAAKTKVESSSTIARSLVTMLLNARIQGVKEIK